MKNISMSLQKYFSDLIEKVTNSDEISNAGKDDNGFYKPTRTVLLRHLNLLKDLHDKPRARDMVKVAWASVVKDLPPEWLTLTQEDRAELRKILETAD
jgi:hypothetical protein